AATWNGHSKTYVITGEIENENRYKPIYKVIFIDRNVNRKLYGI
ncbi:hypothetical protein MNBD_GAMMA13-1093, partial [hydrothermal vent metagenome]